MNYLAHAFLGFDDAEWVAGQLAGDFVKGRNLSAYPHAIRQGIRMHRQLDAWADSHPIFRRSCQRLSPERRRVAGILVDLAYDHCLACQWSHYCHTDLLGYADFVYQTLAMHAPNLPPTMQTFIQRSAEIRLLERYQHPSALARAIDVIDARMSKRGLFAGALDDVMQNLPALSHDFAEFFPHAIRHMAGLAPQPGSVRIYGDHNAVLPKTEVFLR
ncbi:MAG TPA: ACP phosphodiesterase [Gammaproteobacteria bacterium]|jgi:acyl carrier protein phosphodiesterase|nr:ACP phosphodiesterase [Gammaproteobacteria bacterium]